MNYGVTVGVGHVLLTWIVKHAAWIHNRYQLHSDGRTSYERRWGNNYNKPICEFGETVNFQYATRPSKTTSNWSTGIWLGRRTKSDEHYVATKDDVFRTRTIRRLNRSDRYNKELLDAVVSTPWATKGVGRQPTEDFVLQGTTSKSDTDTKDSDQPEGSTKDTGQPSGEENQSTMEADGRARTPDACVSSETTSSSSSSSSSTTGEQTPTMDHTCNAETALAIPLTIPEKRSGSELQSEGQVAKKTRTVMHTTIAPVTQVVTKRGTSVTIDCNEEPELRLSDPLLSD